MSLADAQIERYSRQIILPQVGGSGQIRLLAARVLIVGTGDLGWNAALYLGAAGIGALGFACGASADPVARGSWKERARDVERRNPDCTVRIHAEEATACAAGVGDYDVVADAAGEVATSARLNDACVAARVPLVVARSGGSAGWVATFAGFRPEAPCYRCASLPLADEPRGDAAALSGLIPALLGTVLAAEVLKLLLAAGSPLIGRRLSYDAHAATFAESALAKDPACAVCAPVGGPRAR